MVGPRVSTHFAGSGRENRDMQKAGMEKKKRFDKCPNPAEILGVYYNNFPLPH